MPKLSLSQLGFPHTTLQEDIDISEVLALDGIGLIGAKTDDADREETKRLLEAANLQAAVCAPKLFSILPQPNVARFPGQASNASRSSVRLCSAVLQVPPVIAARMMPARSSSNRCANWGGVPRKLVLALVSNPCAPTFARTGPSYRH